MIWKEYFDNNILKRGKKYYDEGRVEDYVETGDQVAARVAGTKVYYVLITNAGSDTKWEARCTCPHALDGHFCKHEAAVMYQWEVKHRPASNDVDIKDILDDKADRSRLYFNLANITNNLCMTQKTANKLKTFQKKHDVAIAEINQYYGGYFSNRDLMIDAVGIIDGDTESPLNAAINRNAIEMLTCSYCGKRYYKPYYFYDKKFSICEHMAAFLQKLDWYIRMFNPGDATDWKGSRFLDTYGKMRRTRKSSEELRNGGTIQLQPRVIRDEDGLQLAFRIGTDKMYAVKNMTDLVNQVQSKGTLQLGKNNSLSFAQNTFAESAKPAFDLITREVQSTERANEKLMRRRSYHGAEIHLTNSISLTGYALDAFYDMELQRQVEFRDKLQNVSAKTMQIMDIEPKVEMTISPAMDESQHFEGVMVSGSLPYMYEGSRYQYYMQDNVLSRMKEETYTHIRPFLDTQRLDSSFEFEIGKKELSEFYYRVLPELEEDPFIQITEEQPEVIDKALPPEVQFTFYLDAGDEYITCRAKAGYDDKEHVLCYPEEKDLPIAPYRDFDTEMATLDMIRENFPIYNDAEKFFLCDRNDDTVFELLDSGIDKLMDIGEVRSTDAFERLQIRRPPRVSVGVSLESDLMNLEITTDDLSPEELLDLLESYKQKKKYHILKTGQYVRLEEDDSLETLMLMMETMGISLKEFAAGKMHLPLYRALYLDKMLEDHEEIAADRDRNFRNLVKNFKTVKESDFEVPDSLKKTMRNYQVYGYKWIRTLSETGFGGILADDMGLGKTLQMISVILKSKEDGHTGTSLIVCPASLVYNWEEEFHKFAPEIEVKTITGTKSVRRGMLDKWQEADVLVTSYDLLKRDIDLYEGKKFLYQVLDEAQFIKNPKAAVSKAVKIIQSTHKMALTGTPIENRLSELWSIFDFLMPGFLYTYNKFKTQIETPVVKNKDEQASERLQKMVSPFILRRLKEQVLKDLPEKLEEVQYARMDEKQRRLYDAQVVHMRNMLGAEGDDGRDKIKILAELTKIREICCDPSLLIDNYDGESAKREACMDLIRSAIDGGHKMLVFSQFTSMLALLEKDLANEGISYYKITGATSKEERLKLVHAFNRDDTPVFLISLKAGGTGLNLTGADVVIHYDPWWNLAAQNQATDRAHRIGQTRQVTVYRLIVKNTIEEKILKMQETKKELADAVLRADNASISSLSREELMELIGA